MKTPYQPGGVGLSCWHEYIIITGGSASLVRRRRILLGRSRHRRERGRPAAVDLSGRFSHGRIPHWENLTHGPGQTRMPPGGVEETVTTPRLRIVDAATHGDPSTAIYEVRCYAP